MERRNQFAALLVALAFATSACDAGSPNAAGGEAGEAMQEEAGADGYPDLEMDAGGGSVTDSTDADYPGAGSGSPR